jgi:hypothetical protein
MDDKIQIQEAYGAMIQLLFRVFFESFTAAHGDSEQERGAEERFKGGIAHARHVRDRAISLLQPDP